MKSEENAYTIPVDYVTFPIFILEAELG